MPVPSFRRRCLEHAPQDHRRALERDLDARCRCRPCKKQSHPPGHAQCDLRERITSARPWWSSAVSSGKPHCFVLDLPNSDGCFGAQRPILPRPRMPGNKSPSPREEAFSRTGTFRLRLPGRWGVPQSILYDTTPRLPSLRWPGSWAGWCAVSVGNAPAMSLLPCWQQSAGVARQGNSAALQGGMFLAYVSPLRWRTWFGLRGRKGNYLKTEAGSGGLGSSPTFRGGGTCCHSAAPANPSCGLHGAGGRPSR